MTDDQTLDVIEAWLEGAFSSGYPLATFSVKPDWKFGLRQADGYPPPPPPFNVFAASIDLPRGADAQAVAQGLKETMNADRTLGNRLNGPRAHCEEVRGRQGGVQPQVELSITISG